MENSQNLKFVLAFLKFKDKKFCFDHKSTLNFGLHFLKIHFQIA